MTNNVRIKLFKLEKVADIIDELNTSCEYMTNKKNEILAKTEDEREYWETAQLPEIDMKLVAYAELIKTFEKML